MSASKNRAKSSHDVDELSDWWSGGNAGGFGKCNGNTPFHPNDGTANNVEANSDIARTCVPCSDDDTKWSGGVVGNASRVFGNFPNTDDYIDRYAMKVLEEDDDGNALPRRKIEWVSTPVSDFLTVTVDGHECELISNTPAANTPAVHVAALLEETESSEDGEDSEMRDNTEEDAPLHDQFTFRCTSPDTANEIFDDTHLGIPILRMQAAIVLTARSDCIIII